MGCYYGVLADFRQKSDITSILLEFWKACQKYILHAGKDLSNEYLDKLICPEEFWHISFFIQIHCLEIFLHIGFLDWKNSNIQFLSGRSCGIKLCLSRFSFKDLGHITCIVWKSSEQHNLPITRASQASTH